MPIRSLSTSITNLLEEKHLLSVQEILKIFTAQGQTYNKTSVYRALEKLEQAGVICQHHFSNDTAMYELKEHHHLHLVCTRCGTISTGECTYTQPDQVGSFVVDHHHTTLFGVCGRCQSPSTQIEDTHTDQTHLSE